jgi:hypothetical protein
MNLHSRDKKQNEILKGQNDKLQKQLTDAQNIISSSKKHMNSTTKLSAMLKKSY